MNDFPFDDAEPIGDLHITPSADSNRPEKVIRNAFIRHAYGLVLIYDDQGNHRASFTEEDWHRDSQHLRKTPEGE